MMASRRSAAGMCRSRACATAMPGHPGGPLRVGGVDRHPVRAGLLERERHRDQPAVELGHRHLHGRVHRGERGAGRRPGRPGRGQAQRLQHRDVQGGQRGHVPGVVITARGRVRGHRPARREHGDDDRVHPLEQVVELRAARRAASRRTRAPRWPRTPRPRRPACRRTRCSRRPRASGRTRCRRWGGRAGAAARHAGRGARPYSGSTSGGSKPSPVSRIVSDRNRASWARLPRAAFAQVGQGLGGHPGGHRGQRHQLRVRGRLAAEHHRGQAAGQHGVQALGPAAAAAEQAHHHAERAVQQRGQVRRRGTGRVGQPPVSAALFPGAGPGGQQVGVRSREQHDARRGHHQAEPSSG